MEPVLLSGRANRALAEKAARELALPLAECPIESFPDGEAHVAVRALVRGRPVFLFQPASPPPAEHVVELALLADACRREGAAPVTAMVPYFAYARQERRAVPGEAVGGRVAADLLATRVGDVIAVDLHEPAVEAFLPAVEHLSAVALLAEALGPLPEQAVVVAPDLGAVRQARRFADLLGLPVAYVHKVRHSGTDVEVLDVSGEVRGREVLLVDDMISTGATLISAAEALLDRGCRPRLRIAATHGPLLAGALERLQALPLEALIVTDSIPHAPGPAPPLRVVSLAPLLAGAIRRRLEAWAERREPR